MIGSKARRLGLAGALWLGAFAAGGCTLITDVDRSKIPPATTTLPPQDSGTDAGGQAPEDSGVPPTPTETPDSSTPSPDGSVGTDAAVVPDAAPSDGG